MDIVDIQNRFFYHPPTESKKLDHEHVRRMSTDMALELNDLLPEGREKSLAITHLEEVMFWSNAAIARHHPDD